MQETSEISDIKGFDSYQLKLGDLMRGERATLGKSLLDVQRDLRIKATYIAAIENCDPSVFQTQGFVAGHVRSYARYLSLDPDEVFAMFCAESNFSGTNPRGEARAKPQATLVKTGLAASSKPGLSLVDSATSPSGKTPFKAPSKLSAFTPTKSANKPMSGLGSRSFSDPIASPHNAFTPVSDGLVFGVTPSALASMLVLLALIFGIGYGGWVVLQDIQRVEFAPIEQTPGLVAGITALDQPEVGRNIDTAILPIPRQASGGFYRPQGLDVPVMIARDGPISTLNSDAIGALVSGSGTIDTPEFETTPFETALIEASPQVVATAAPVVRVVAARAAWVRLSESDGTVLFEKILNAGESFELPNGAAPMLRAGNSGYVYITVGDQTFGPVGKGTSVAKNVALDAAAVLASLQPVKEFDQLQALDNPKIITLNALGD